MELEVGMYVRTKKGIYKINHFINNNYTQKFTYIDNQGVSNILDEEEIIKESYNIIDLIEVGDYVNGEKVEEVILDNKMSRIKTTECSTYFEEDIYSIVTSQQFESMSYKVGD